MRDQIKIRNRTMGKGHPLLITAEIGVTCNYDVQISKELIDVVHKTGADAVKLIFWFPEEIFIQLLRKEVPTSSKKYLFLINPG